MLKIFLSGVLPLLALAGVWWSVICLYRGARMLLRRLGQWWCGLHAETTLRRHGAAGEVLYVPVFSYHDAQGNELNILGKRAFATEAEALQQRRPLVYAAERPDAAVAHNALTFLAKPLLILLWAVVLLALAHYILLYMPD